MNKPQILIITNCHDVHTDHLVPLLEELGSQVFRLNTEDLLQHELTYRIGNEGYLQTRLHAIDYSRLVAVWYRKPNEYRLPSEWAGFDQFLRAELRATMGGIYRSLTGVRWMNQLDAQQRASYKLVQLSTARKVGLSIPDTLITTSPTEVRRFFDLHPQGVAVKSLGGGLIHLPEDRTIFTNRLQLRDFQNLQRVKQFPHFIQAYIEKEAELRITFVGDELFVCEMDTQASPRRESRVDWRRYDLDNVSYSVGTLPRETEQQLRTLMRDLNLVYGAVDVIRTPSGQHVFLEVNPGGQWLWVEQRTGLPISAAIARYLSGHASLSSTQASGTSGGQTQARCERANCLPALH